MNKVKQYLKIIEFCNKTCLLCNYNCDWKSKKKFVKGSINNKYNKFCNTIFYDMIYKNKCPNFRKK